MKSLTVIAAVLMAACLGSAQQVEPEVPSTFREVTGVIDAGVNPVHFPYFTRPHVPGFRSTADGRIAVIVEGNSTMRVPGFTLIKPEKTTTPILLNPGGSPTDQSSSYTMTDPGFAYLDGNSSQAYINANFTDGVKTARHACLWDADPPIDVGGKDVYEVDVFVTTNEPDTSGGRTFQFFVTKVKITVANPKTSTASIESIVRAGPTIAGPLFSAGTTGFGGSGFEPVIAGDGGLLVLRIASDDYTFTHPDTSITSPPGHDIVYSYYDPTGIAQADPSRWTDIYPITYAPDDSRINTKFGFAKHPFRDGAGNPITSGQDLGGSYPWIDRDAKNLFFEAVRDQLRYKQGSTWNLLSRYPQEQVPGDTWYGAEVGENSGTHQGVSFIGSWGHGKLVQLDNLLNDMDYAIGDGAATPTPQARLVDLYQAGTYPSGVHDGKLVLGYGRTTGIMPPGENDNGNIIDSIENKLNANDAARFIRLQDVVWTMTNGRQTEEFGFDDHMDPDAFVIANMAGALTWNQGVSASAIHGSSLKHHTSWNGVAWDPGADPVKLQNGATGTRWKTPAYGVVEGPGRLEPAANGGVRGKGYWMDGTIGLRFDVPLQVAAEGNPDVSDHDWYIGLFVDCRFDDDGVRRRVLTFPDGTAVFLHGRSQVLFADANGTIVNRMTLPPTTGGLPDLLPRFGWSHLGFQVSDAGSQVDVHLNGLLYHRWTRHPDGKALFQMTAGALTLGKVAAQPEPGFAGWTDELKIFAHSVDLETACNHAAATLIGLPDTYSGTWRTDHADRYPDWVHDEISDRLRNAGETSNPRYAAFHDRSGDNTVHRGTIPAGTEWRRASVHFPEGPLYYNAPRPHSSLNTFCLTCHHTQGVDGFGLGALPVIHGLKAKNDARRQPSQPAAQVHGVIPAGLVTNTAHATPQPTSAMTGPEHVDEFMLESYAGNAQVTSITLMNGTTGDDLMELKPGAVVDPARLGTTSFGLRANLDHEQGGVYVSFNSLASINPSTVPPHIIPFFTGGPFGGAGSATHTARATGDSGVMYAVTFTLLGAAWREVANYRDDFRPGSPTDGWRYRWNLLGPVNFPANYADLHWDPSAGRYTVDGLAFPTTNPGAFASFTPTGGHPGRGSSQTGTADRYVLASYTTKLAGEYKIDGGALTFPGSGGAANGGVVGVVTIDAGVLTVQQVHIVPAGGSVTFSMPATNFAAGVEIIVAVGPNSVDTADGFTLDYAIDYRP